MKGIFTRLAAVLLAAALAAGAQLYGTGSGGSHLVSGHSAAHQALDEALE